jgi:hypothetical protein
MSDLLSGPGPNSDGSLLLAGADPVVGLDVERDAGRVIACEVPVNVELICIVELGDTPDAARKSALVIVKGVFVASQLEYMTSQTLLSRVEIRLLELLEAIHLPELITQFPPLLQRQALLD